MTGGSPGRREQVVALARSARMGTLNQTSPKKPGGPGKWVRSTGIEMNISDMDVAHLKNAAAMCRRNAMGAHPIITTCGVDVVIDQLDVRDKLIHKAEELEAELTRRAAPKPVAPAWVVDPSTIKVGDLYVVYCGMTMTSVHPGKVRIVKLVVDHTDDAPVPYYEIVVRYVTHPNHPDARLCGPQIKYHLRRVES